MTTKPLVLGLLSLLVVVPLALAPAGPALADARVVIIAHPREAPPPPPPEVAETRAGWVWVGGHYRWERGRYVWVGGHMVRERRGHVWHEGRWRRHGRDWRWHDGGWHAHR